MLFRHPSAPECRGSACGGLPPPPPKPPAPLKPPAPPNPPRPPNPPAVAVSKWAPLRSSRPAPAVAFIQSGGHLGKGVPDKAHLDRFAARSAREDEHVVLRPLASTAEVGRARATPSLVMTETAAVDRVRVQLADVGEGHDADRSTCRHWTVQGQPATPCRRSTSTARRPAHWRCRPPSMTSPGYWSALPWLNPASR